jgi:alkanesulfonate monooxygenase SsuD/methylene tetrahydromethanopterin reductase-like flavin-dependent oxidoreductase (luciferase family)
MSGNPSGDAIVSLARLAALSQRVQIGTAVLLLPLYPPAIVARQVADLDISSDGRIILGVGVGGEYPQEFRACQVPLDERGRRADEGIAVIRKLWTGQQISHTGTFYPMADVRLIPGPGRPGGPPIVVAGRKTPAMRRAALLGDGWMPYLYSARRYAASTQIIRDFARQAGRDLSGFGWFAYLFVNVARSGSEARRKAAELLGQRYNRDMTEMLDSIATVGSPGEVAEKIETFAEAGARHFVFSPLDAPEDQGRSIDLLIDSVIPQLTGR